ncbi:MAG: tyrosine-type recombinase/integrase [Candidatus Binatia bacterium]
MPKYRRGSGSVYKKRGVYYIAYYTPEGKQVCESAKTKDKAEARRKLQSRLGELADSRYVGPAPERVTFEELANMILDDYRVNGRKSYNDVEWRIRCHLRPFFNQKRAHEITTADVKAYIAHRQTEGAKNGSINRELAALKRMFNLALQAEKIIKKPYIPSLEENNARKGFFEQAEYEAVLAKLPEHLRPIVTFAYYTGWRIRSEVLPLIWTQVDMETGTVRLEVGETKNKDGRLIYLTAELRALLALQWQDHVLYPECPWVFHDHGKRIKTFYKNWRKACQTAGLPGKLGHDFRRTAVRNMVRSGIPERVAMQIAGHKTRSVFDRYHVVADGDLKEAAQRLDRAFSPQTTTLSTTLSPSAVERIAVNH